MIKYIKIDKGAYDETLVAKTYGQIRRDFGFLAEPFTLHTPAPTTLAASWILIREVMLVGDLDQRIKEVIATAVSESNQCPYCVDAHTIMFKALGGRVGYTFTKHDNPDIQLAYRWGSTTTTPGVGFFQQFSLPPNVFPEIFGTALAFHYINRMVSVFLDETPLPVQNRRLRDIQQQLAAIWLRSTVRRSKVEGDSLSLLPKVECHGLDNLRWLELLSNIGSAICKWADALEQSGAQALTIAARACIHHHLELWNGEKPPLGTLWLDEITKGLQGEDLAGARLGILTALCAYRVTDKHIQDYRNFQSLDSSLVSAVAWASMKTALRIASRWY